MGTDTESILALSLWVGAVSYGTAPRIALQSCLFTLDHTTMMRLL